MAEAEAGSGVALGDRAAFSVATIESGRLRGRSDDCELGRRCQERGEFLDGGIAVECEAFIRFRSDTSFPCRPSNGAEFSFVGDVEEPFHPSSIASSWVASRRDSGSWSGCIFGDPDCDRLPGCARDILDAFGVVEGEDFVGDIDLARSEQRIVSQMNIEELY